MRALGKQDGGGLHFIIGVSAMWLVDVHCRDRTTSTSRPISKRRASVVRRLGSDFRAEHYPKCATLASSVGLFTLVNSLSRAFLVANCYRPATSPLPFDTCFSTLSFTHILCAGSRTTTVYHNNAIVGHARPALACILQHIPRSSGTNRTARCRREKVLATVRWC